MKLREAYELNNIWERPLELLDVIWYLRGSRKRADACCERNKYYRRHDGTFPRCTPVKRVIGRCGRLWHEDVIAPMLEMNIPHYEGNRSAAITSVLEAVRTICHNLSTRHQFHVEGTFNLCTN
jgi:hypothetical protein